MTQVSKKRMLLNAAKALEAGGISAVFWY